MTPRYIKTLEGGREDRTQPQATARQVLLWGGVGRRGFIGSLVAAAVACVVPLTKKRPVIEAHVDQGDGKITVIELEAINRRLIDDIIYQLRRQQRRDEVAVPLGRPDEAG